MRSFKTIKKILTLSLLLGTFITFSLTANAQQVDHSNQSNPYQYSVYIPLAPIPVPNGGQLGGTTATGKPDISLYFKQLYQIGVGVATALAVLMVIWGGVEYVTTDAIGGKENGKERVQNALIGLLLALGSYIILKTINPALVTTTLNVPQTNASAAPFNAPAIVDLSGGSANSPTGVNGSRSNILSQWTPTDQQAYDLALADQAAYGDAGLTPEDQAALDKWSNLQGQLNALNNGSSTGSAGPVTTSTGQPVVDARTLAAVEANSQNGIMFPSSVISNADALTIVEQSGILNGPIPSDAAQFFPGGVPTAQGYVNLLASVAYQEDGINPNELFDETLWKSSGHTTGAVTANTNPNDVISGGLLQLSTSDAAVINAAQKLGVPDNTAALQNPAVNLTAGVQILKQQIASHKKITGSTYWSTLQNGD